MQFQYNSDLPGVQPDGSHIPTEARNPLEFPPAQPLPCARITTRIFHPSRNQVATVHNVLVRTIVVRPPTRRSSNNNNNKSASNSDDMLSSSSSSSSDDDDDDDDDRMQDDDDNNRETAQNSGTSPQEEEARAYWIQRTIRDAIYGKVLFALVLKRRKTTTPAANDNAEWEVTEQRCAIKEMSWQHIRRERHHLAEDPIKEVSAMQYLKQWHFLSQQTRGQEARGAGDTVSESFRAIIETNIMMPLDLLSDDRHLYSIMPFCDGGELFERLDMNERFTENEARYWMNQILNGLENMQNSGICHRDISLENLLVHDSGALIIDMGMCLRVPLESSSSSQSSPASELSLSMQNMAMNGTVPAYIGGAEAEGAPTSNDEIVLMARRQKRFLIRPQGTCGKWIYMSPEIFRNKEPFDGFAVDMWAAGVILFLMISGFPPWERACQTDERFKYMSAGYLVQMLTEWNLGLSSDAMDLLQRMLFIDPKDRLSLEQVRAHPWMVNGPSEPPLGF